MLVMTTDDETLLKIGCKVCLLVLKQPHRQSRTETCTSSEGPSTVHASRRQHDVLTFSNGLRIAHKRIDTYSGKSHGSKHIVSNDFQQRHHQRNEPSTDECEGDCS